MSVIKRFISFGTIVKTTGNYGALIIATRFPVSSFIKPSTYIFINIEGDFVPFFVTSTEHISDETLTVCLEDTSLDDWPGFRSKEVYIPEGHIKETTSILPETDLLLGFIVQSIDKSFSATISAIEHTPHYPLVQLWHNEKEVILPLAAELIDSIDFEGKIIVMNIPDGLIET